MKWIKVRRNFLLYSSFIVYVGVLVLLLLFLDRSVFQERKKSIIVDRFAAIFPDTAIDRARMTQLAQKYFTYARGAAADSGAAEQARQALADLERHMQGILAKDLPIYELALEDNNRNVILSVSDPEKLRTFNTWDNCLFLRGFHSVTSLPIPVDNFSENRHGRFVARYTTPRDLPEIAALTSQFRLYALMVFLALTALYLLLFFSLIRPVMRVVESLERESGQPVRLISRPGSLLERYYNNLARSALLMEFQSQAHAVQGGGSGVNLIEFLRRLPEIAAALFPFFRVSLLEIAAMRGGPQVRHVYGASPSVGAVLESEAGRRQLAEQLEPLFADRSGEGTTSRLTLKGTGGQLDVLALPLVFAGREESWLAVLIEPCGGASLDDRWSAQTAQLLAEQFDIAIRQVFTQQMLIFREKSETSVNLSRNLGHDLTNIIATGKLDLLTVKQFLNTPVEELERSPQKREIFKQSLDALLNNTRFMQEIVNIYRSFSYIKKPIYETCDMNELVQDTVMLFALATSRGIKFETELNPHAPLSVLERRLIKLALFNMLNNSAESIQRRTRSENISGVIVVKTLYDPALDMVGLSVIDNGAGIRNKSGQLATEAEIDHIFSLGFTTKQRDEGEGLGLNWVYSIVVEFHRGKIAARNRSPEEGGGAEFQILVPVRPPVQTTAEGAPDQRPAAARA
ncbi:MAG: hypothetical protein Kow0059_06590 [Candidatus Sumerlaeia bacterium]